MENTAPTNANVNPELKVPLRDMSLADLRELVEFYPDHTEAVDELNRRKRHLVFRDSYVGDAAQDAANLVLSGHGSAKAFDYIKLLADGAHAAYPQYRGHWDGWNVGIIAKTTRTKGGEVVKGDAVLWVADREDTGVSVYSIRMGGDVALTDDRVLPVAAGGTNEFDGRVGDGCEFIGAGDEVVALVDGEVVKGILVDVDGKVGTDDELATINPDGGGDWVRAPFGTVAHPDSEFGRAWQHGGPDAVAFVAAIAIGTAYPAAVENRLEEDGLIVQTDEPYARVTPAGEALLRFTPSDKYVALMGDNTKVIATGTDEAEARSRIIAGRRSLQARHALNIVAIRRINRAEAVAFVNTGELPDVVRTVDELHGLRVGQRVRATLSGDEGTISALRDDRGVKPIAVDLDAGGTGYFHLDQIAALEEAGLTADELEQLTDAIDALADMLFDNAVDEDGINKLAALASGAQKIGLTALADHWDNKLELLRDSVDDLIESNRAYALRDATRAAAQDDARGERDR